MNAARKRVDSSRTSTSQPVVSKTRAAGRRPARRWLTAALLFVAASLAVAYIANAIAVNNLVESIASLERERDAVRSDNESLRGQLVRMMSVERVTALAKQRIGLISPERPPYALNNINGTSASAQNKSGTTQRGDKPIRP